MANEALRSMQCCCVLGAYLIGDRLAGLDLLPPLAAAGPAAQQHGDLFVPAPLAGKHPRGARRHHWSRLHEGDGSGPRMNASGWAAVTGISLGMY